eukprot:TRINITY_DN3747_c0_g1_i1.p2 TRINITY_DN3747_c0_g1~~TRINITY_DN3747_c0_g1_i1.p2  ORF type:complete len:425 (+),score=120.48 TRINITY_DN3747_c0_g1_i1:105-1277(+)
MRRKSLLRFVALGGAAVAVTALAALRLRSLARPAAVPGGQPGGAADALSARVAQLVHAQEEQGQLLRRLLRAQQQAAGADKHERGAAVGGSSTGGRISWAAGGWARSGGRTTGGAAGDAAAARKQQEADPYARWRAEPLLSGVTEPQTEWAAAPPYLAPFERGNLSEARLPRHAAGGGFDGYYTWRVLSKRNPRAIYVSRYWNDEECDQIVKWARPSIERSRVVDTKGGLSDVRTSEGMFLTSPTVYRHPIVEAARRRTALLANLRPENIEATQVLRYKEGQYYVAHPDYFAPQFTEHLNRGGQRVASLLSWLTDTKEGGETSFPNARPKVITVRPRKGDAVIFWNCEADLRPGEKWCTPDPTSMHRAWPPKHGSEKWVAVQWIRQHRFT